MSKFGLMRTGGKDVERKGGLADSLKKQGDAKPVARPDEALYQQTINGNGKVAFVFDATASREGTWDEAKKIQGRMLRGIEGVEINMIYYRGNNGPMATGWQKDPDKLVGTMNEVTCQSGSTEIVSSLDVVLQDKKNEPGIVVLVGDAFEENKGALEAKAKQLKAQGVKVFAFQEGDDDRAKDAFSTVAEITGGAYAKFDNRMPLNDLCTAVGTLATGGEEALKKLAKTHKAAAAIAAGMKMLGPGGGK
jgi:hypothetical protein